MKRQILMAITAMLISMAAIAGSGTKAKTTTCTGNCCTKTACNAKCVCDTKKCTPATCPKGISSDKSKSCNSCTNTSGKSQK